MQGIKKLVAAFAVLGASSAFALNVTVVNEGKHPIQVINFDGAELKNVYCTSENCYVGAAHLLASGKIGDLAKKESKAFEVKFARFAAVNEEWTKFATKPPKKPELYMHTCNVSTDATIAFNDDLQCLCLSGTCNSVGVSVNYNRQ